MWNIYNVIMESKTEIWIQFWLLHSFRYTIRDGTIQIMNKSHEFYRFVLCKFL